MLEDYEILPKTITVKINNHHNTSITVKLSAYNDDSLRYEGYDPLPNMSWVQFNETEITVPANAWYHVPVTLDTPNITENYNKSWQFFVFADQIAGGELGEQGATFQYDYNLRWNVQTPERYIPMGERKARNQGMDIGIPWFLVAGILIIAVTLTGRTILKKGKKHEKEKNKTHHDSSHSSN